MIRRRASAGRCFAVATIAAAAFAPGPRAAVHADPPVLADRTPAALAGVGIEEHLDETLPLDLPFRDEEGRTITVGDCLEPGRPVILTLNYFRCPMLCSLTLNGLVSALGDIEDWSAGSEFDIVTVSIAPEEGPELAAVKKKVYVAAYDRPGVAEGWHFLTGEQASIEGLASAVGFGYRRDERTGDYAHSASIMFITPDGRISRYMNDVNFKPRDVRLALVEASEGRIGSPMERLLLFMCYHYDPAEGSYAMSAVKLMRLGGLLTLVTILTGLFILWRRGPHVRLHAVAGPPPGIAAAGREGAS